MQTTITYKRMPPSSISGECLTVSITYTSFNAKEIDQMEQYYKQNIGYATTIVGEEEKNYVGEGDINNNGNSTLGDSICKLQNRNGKIGEE